MVYSFASPNSLMLFEFPEIDDSEHVPGYLRQSRWIWSKKPRFVIKLVKGGNCRTNPGRRRNSSIEICTSKLPNSVASLPFAAAAQPNNMSRITVVGLKFTDRKSSIQPGLGSLGAFYGTFLLRYNSSIVRSGHREWCPQHRVALTEK